MPVTPHLSEGLLREKAYARTMLADREREQKARELHERFVNIKALALAVGRVSPVPLSPRFPEMRLEGGDRTYWHRIDLDGHWPILACFGRIDQPGEPPLWQHEECCASSDDPLAPGLPALFRVVRRHQDGSGPHDLFARTLGSALALAEMSQDDLAALSTY